MNIYDYPPEYWGFESNAEYINEVLKELCVDKEFDVETLLWVSSKGEYDEATSN